ncbi:MAG TPA: hypothetical protein VHW24_25245 [Bryobacteraceae bacterium]|jgi:hypothetical protein|nr:hypothetical protein [Bryobacteraceae bacterium]
MMAVILSVWCAAIAARAFAIYRMWRNGISRRLQALWYLLIVANTQAVVGLVLLKHVAIYENFYTVTAWFELACEVAAPLGVIWVLAENAPQYRKSVTLLLSMFGTVGVAACWLVGYWRVPADWFGVWHFAIYAQRGVEFIMLAMLGGARLLLPSVSQGAIRSLARRAADILLLHITLSLLASELSILGGERLRNNGIVSVIILASGAVTGLLCALALTKESDQVHETDQMPPLDFTGIDSELLN